MATNIKPDSQTLNLLSQLSSNNVRNTKTLDIGATSNDPRQRGGASIPKQDADSDARVAGGLSSAEELQAAKQRAIDFSTTNTREAPFGRLSESVDANGRRNIPLGQIIDIRV